MYILFVKAKRLEGKLPTWNFTLNDMIETCFVELDESVEDSCLVNLTLVVSKSLCVCQRRCELRSLSLLGSVLDTAQSICGILIVVGHRRGRSRRSGSCVVSVSVSRLSVRRHKCDQTKGERQLANHENVRSSRPLERASDPSIPPAACGSFSVVFEFARKEEDHS